MILLQSYVLAQGEQMNFQSCSLCGRTFNPDSLVSTLTIHSMLFYYVLV